ncbi:MAG: hypothetical protein ABOK23_00670 [Candidatus Methanoperedens sp.]|nr:hypothetical protein [Candidatus Methanoperedens sp.]MCZ7395868.1 hypothetical protein [Candidatus Methanoperedens sp.]
MNKIIVYALLGIFAFVLFSNVAVSTLWAPEANEISFQVNHTDRIIIGTVKELHPSFEYTDVVISVDEWLKNPLPKTEITVRTEQGANAFTAGAAKFSLGEKVLLMLKDVDAEKGTFSMPFMELGKRPVSDRDAVVKETDSVEQAFLGLNTNSELLPDFGHEVFEKMKNDSKILTTYGNIPTIKIETQKREWLEKLDEIRIGVREDMLPYVYPNGSVISYGYTWEGYFDVGFYKNATVNASLVNEIYGIIDKEAKEVSIQEVPVAFSLGDMPQLDLLVLNNSNKDMSKPENSTITPSVNKNTPPIGEARGKAVPGFEAILALGILSFTIYMMKRKNERG